MNNIIVVGAGMFGIMAAELAVKKGMEVTVVDCRAENRATPCSGFLLKPSWLTALSKEEIEKGYEILRRLYVVETLEFKLLPTNAKIKIDRVRYKTPSMVKKIVRREVIAVDDGVVTLDSGELLKGKVLVAAGAHTGELICTPIIKRLMGVSLRFRDKQIKTPLMNVWAPYKQAVAFNYDSSSVWFGDGTSVLEKNWDTKERVDSAITRAKKLFKLSGPCDYYVGARPYVEGYKGGYFDRPFKNTWVSTGGAKNGTLLAALQADKFIEEAL